MQVGKAHRKLYGFVLVLSYSRRIFLHFGFDIGMAGFLRGHQLAFERLGGVPRVLLYDNLKSAVLDRIGEAIRFHPTLLEFAAWHRYEPRPVAVARGNEKGRVERAIRYVRTAFFAGRQWTSIDDLNRQAAAWTQTEAEERGWPQDRAQKVAAAFEHEKSALLPLPADRFPTLERLEVAVGKTPYVRFDLNDYSVPHTSVRKDLVVVASLAEVRVLDGSKVIACHARSFDKGQQIEDAAHVEALVAYKRKARHHRAQDRVVCAVPAIEQLLVRLAARGDSPGTAVAYLGRLLDRYGQDDLQHAVLAALQAGTPHPHNVRLLLERLRHARHAPEPPTLPAMNDPKLRDLHVTQHDLGGYDRLIPTTPKPKETTDD